MIFDYIVTHKIGFATANRTKVRLSLFCFVEYSSYICCRFIWHEKTFIMKKTELFHRVSDFYYRRLGNMGLGRTLCVVVVLKLFIIFAVLKLFFFPDFIRSKVPRGNKADYVSSQVIGRAVDGKQTSDS